MNPPTPPPADTFVTRGGRTLALKPWTAPLIVQHADAVQRFVLAFMGVSLNQPLALGAFDGVLPALRESLQTPEALDELHGLHELMRLCEAVWDYNELGAGLGKSAALGVRIQQEMLTASGGVLNVEDPPASEPRRP